MNETLINNIKNDIYKLENITFKDDVDSTNLTKILDQLKSLKKISETSTQTTDIHEIYNNLKMPIKALTDF